MAASEAFGPNFRRIEFACRCGCGFDTVDAELLYVLKMAREYFGRPVEITSGNRCQRHNAVVGGSPNSMHLESKAADIKIAGVTPDATAAYFIEQYPEKYGIGKYNSWVHIDVRPEQARWGFDD